MKRMLREKQTVRYGGSRRHKMPEENIIDIFSFVSKCLLEIIEENKLGKEEIIATLKSWKNKEVKIKK